MFAAFPEIYDWIEGNDEKIYSKIFAIFITIGCIAVLFFSGWYWHKYAGKNIITSFISLNIITNS